MNDMIANRVYVREYVGSHLVYQSKRWIDIVKDFLQKKKFGGQESKISV